MRIHGFAASFPIVFHLSVFTCPLQQTIRWCILPWTIHQRLVNDQVKKRCKGIGLPSITGIWPSWDIMGISANDPLMRRDCFYVVFLSAAHVIIVCWVMTDLCMFTHQGSCHLRPNGIDLLFFVVCVTYEPTFHILQVGSFCASYMCKDSCHLPRPVAR